MCYNLFLTVYFLYLVVQAPVGSVDPSHAVLCVRLAASYGRIDGGLCGGVGSLSPHVDTGSLVGAAHFTTATTRGKAHLISCKDGSNGLECFTFTFPLFPSKTQAIFIPFISCLVGG